MPDVRIPFAQSPAVSDGHDSGYFVDVGGWPPRAIAGGADSKNMAGLFLVGAGAVAATAVTWRLVLSNETDPEKRGDAKIVGTIAILAMLTGAVMVSNEPPEHAPRRLYPWDD